MRASRRSRRTRPRRRRSRPRPSRSHAPRPRPYTPPPNPPQATMHSQRSTQTSPQGPQLFSKMLEMNEKCPKILMIHRLPFPIPDDPATLEIQKTCNNVFTEYTIPYTIIKLKRLIANFTDENGAGKTIYILDNRLTEKDYGATILDSLNSKVQLLKT